MSHAVIDRRPAASLDIARIVAMSAAISLNASLLLVALRPLPAHRYLQPEPSRMVVRLTLHRPLPPAPPALPAPPPPHPRTLPRTPQVATRIQVPGIDPSPLSQARPVAPVTSTIADASSTVTPAQAGSVDAQLTYLRAPPPRYPVPARRARMQGTVTLRVRVDARGQPTDVSVATSSGFPILDRAARRAVMRDWRFQPARVDGRPMPAWALVPVTFRLQ